MSENEQKVTSKQFWENISRNSSSKSFMEENFEKVDLHQLSLNEAIDEHFFKKIFDLQRNYERSLKSFEQKTLESLRKEKTIKEEALKQLQRDLDEIDQEISYLEDFDNEFRKVF